MRPLSIVFLIVVLSISCSKNEERNNNLFKYKLYIGTWIDTVTTDSSLTAIRSSALAENKIGFQINSDGTFVQRSIVGWCGTPPVSLANYEGTWTAFPDNTLFIETEFWGGLATFELEILHVDEEKMVYKIYQYNN